MKLDAKPTLSYQETDKKDFALHNFYAGATGLRLRVKASTVLKENGMVTYLLPKDAQVAGRLKANKNLSQVQYEGAWPS